ncbi:MAG: hypothetical protein RIT04_93 [Candidatus Parcubacteria bacterium]
MKPTSTRGFIPPPFFRLDAQGKEIRCGSVVTVVSRDPDNKFRDQTGVVLEINATYSPCDGPIAVFFGDYTPESCFDHLCIVYSWPAVSKDETSYHRMARVVCFCPEELLAQGQSAIPTASRRQADINPYRLLPAPTKSRGFHELPFTM